MSKDRYTIFPAIGVARVGNSPQQFYIGPEAPDGLPTRPDDGKPIGPADFRDPNGGVARQAARFRIYRSPAGGGAPEEVTRATGGVKDIRWTVYLANKKASWYESFNHHDLHGYPPNRHLRNRFVNDRRSLIADPGPRSLAWSGPGSAGAVFTCPAMKYLPPGTHLSLGELKLDDQGRLLVLGGQGKAYSHVAEVENQCLSDNSNNDMWWDDTSDGPVKATITLDSGEEIEAEPAWVVVAPPRYAPQIQCLVTMYDVILDVMVRQLGARPNIFDNGMWRRDYMPDFATEIEPIFRRAEAYRWVVPMPHKPHDFDYKMLGDPNPRGNSYRRRFLDVLRPPGQQNNLINRSSGVTMMPYLAGDDPVGDFFEGSSKYLRLTDTQYFMLEQWAKGHFGGGDAGVPVDPGHVLTKVALDQCLGGPLAPGFELAWICRDPAIYGGPFRIKGHDTPTRGQLNPGSTPDKGMEPGDLTRYLPVPWHADLNNCTVQWHNDDDDDRPLWWWPSHRPVFVYRGDDAEMTPWIGEGYNQTALNYLRYQDNRTMVYSWSNSGFVYNNVNHDSGARPGSGEPARRAPDPHDKK